ncbi:MAG: tetratricopeptide repeat protein [Marivita sp.]|uniref:helix-turn-helix domain-containing protein n=1 Tax=Marivita sp. TaxID=2003365 RepID=UPI001B2687F1|nr:tetratricopeptide repeat protein [Marivita sp.]MBO6882800.1 tetratricopeptide repeat protein [Marivita sp.]
MTSDLVEFGKAVRLARTAKGMTLEMLAHEALGNQDRKSYVSAVEKGRKRLSALTVQKFATFLELDDPVVARLVTGAADEDEPITQVEVNADAISKELEEVRKTLKLSEALAVSLAYEFAEGNPTDLTSALNELRRAFEVAAKQPTTGNLDADVNAVLEEVRRLNADDRMEEAKEALREALERKKAQQEQVAAEVSALIRSGIDQAVLMRDVEEAARLVVEQVETEVQAPEDRFYAIDRASIDWQERGRDGRLAFDLEVSIAIARHLLERSTSAEKRGKAFNSLATALAILGEREIGTARLEEAVAAYRSALEEHTREQVPLDWAMTQNNLGNALQNLGTRESGTARLEDAVTVFRSALEEYTRERVPLDWAMTQNNLGTALATLGERESGTARLEEAVTAFRAALEVRTRERVPLNWAATQNNLGAALLTLGERESGTERLEEAATAFRAAQKEITRGRLPLNWAKNQSNLGNALLMLGQRDSGTQRLEEAVEAYRAALEEFTPEQLLLDWAMTIGNLAVAYGAMFEKTGDRARLEEAIALVRAAREVFDEAGASYFIEKSDWILARLEAKL